MAFDLTDEQSMIKSLVERFVLERYPMNSSAIYQSEPCGFSQDNWRMLGELGIIATAFHEDNGGLGSDDHTLMLLFEALGRGLVIEPLIESVFEAGRIFEAGAEQTVKSAWLDELITGHKRLALAHTEYAGGNDDEWISTQAVKDGDHYNLSGEKSLVIAGLDADAYVVSAQSGVNGSSQFAFFLVPADTPGLKIAPFRLIDGALACHILFENVTIPSDHRLEGGLDLWRAVRTQSVGLRCAEAVGVMDKMFEDTLEYLRTREQFGQALGSFQALQHRMVEQYVALNECRSLMERVTLQDTKTAKQRAIAGARVAIGERGIRLGHEAIQLHGGMGVSDELPIGRYHKRLVMLTQYPADKETALHHYAGITAP